MVGLTQELVQREHALSKSRYETAECSQTSHDPLHPFQVLDGTEPLDGRDLLRISLNAMLGNYEPELDVIFSKL